MRASLLLLMTLGIFLSQCTPTKTKNESTEIILLREGFQVPPIEARPRALWDWVDGNFSRDEITHEMEEAKAKGMGGFDIWDVRKVVDEKNVVPAGPSFMSDEYLEGIVHAINEAERLGLDLGLIVASGWNAGGAWTKPEHQTMGLYRSTVAVSGATRMVGNMPFPDLPETAGKKGRKKTAIIPKDENGLPLYYKDIKVLAFPMAPDSSIINLDQVVDVSDKMKDNGDMDWLAPNIQWKIIRYVCTNTGQPMISCTPNSVGPMIDHFNPDATVAHINYFIEKIEAKLGKPIGESGLKYFYTDSYEVQGLLWTPNLLEEFEKRMGYSMVPYMPIFDGYTIENENITRRFLYDYRKVWSDLIIESHYAKATEICRNHGIGFVAEAAGPGYPIHNCPFESLKSSGALSFPRGEFWHLPTKTDYWKREHESEKATHYLKDLQVLKGVASASHIYDQKYVEAEAFTGTHIYVEGPGDLKPTVDRAFCEGLNRINFHTFPHTPKEAGEPGWAYSFGTLIHETRIWWPESKPFMDYLGRCSYMLQQGNFHGDVLFFFGDSAPNFVPPKSINPSLGFGYDYDYTNTDIIINKLSVQNGKLTLPHGQNYEVLVLPEEDYMIYPVLEKIGQLIEAGATVIGPKPTRSHGLKDWEKEDAKVQELANKIWGNCDGETITENTYGLGKVVWGKTIKEVLNERNVGPDFDFIGNVTNTSLDFIHRKTENAEIYMVRNATEEPISGDAIFRVKGRQPELWDAINGEMNACKIFLNENETTKIPLQLNPDESIFVVFTKALENNHITKVMYENAQIWPLEANNTNTTFKQCKNNLLFFQDGTYQLQTADGKVTETTIEKASSPLKVEGSWKVFFPEEKKGVGEVTFDELVSWHTSDVFNIQFFSGIASYTKEITIPESFNPEKEIAVLSLGKVRELAHVYVNGKDVGVSWQKPNKINITDYISPGINTIKIDVANTWHNRLCGDAKIPEKERITHSNIIHLPNPWSHEMVKIPFANEKDSYGLQEAGLLGPVEIVFVTKY